MDKPISIGMGRGVRLKPVEIAIVVGLGVAVGLLLGYSLMGTAHAILDIGAEEHYRHDG